MNAHKNGTIVCGNPNSEMRRRSEIIDELVGRGIYHSNAFAEKIKVNTLGEVCTGDGFCIKNLNDVSMLILEVILNE